MDSVGVYEAKNRLPALLDKVAEGEEVVITRHGRAIARLVPIDRGFDREKARRAAEGLREASRGLRLDGLSPRDLIEEGRR